MPVQPFNITLPEGFSYDESVYVSPIGTPIQDIIKIEAGTYYITKDRQIDFEGITLYAAMITVNCPKNIVNTKVAGKDGTIKQYISKDDYVISITGILMSHSEKYPIDQVEILAEIIKAECAITVSSRVLSAFDITEMVIEDASFEPKEGYNNIQEFKIYGRSDEYFELVLKEE